MVEDNLLIGEEVCLNHALMGKKVYSDHSLVREEFCESYAIGMNFRFTSFCCYEQIWSLPPLAE